MNYLRKIALFIGVAATFAMTPFAVQAQEQSACPSGQIRDSNGLCSSSIEGQKSGSMTSAEEFFRHGRQLDKQGLSQEAITEYTRAIELDPNYAPSYFFRGNALALEGQPQKGIEDAQKAAAIYKSRGESQWAEAMMQLAETIRRGIQEGEF